MFACIKCTLQAIGALEAIRRAYLNYIFFQAGKNLMQSIQMLLMMLSRQGPSTLHINKQLLLLNFDKAVSFIMQFLMSQVYLYLYSQLIALITFYHACLA